MGGPGIGRFQHPNIPLVSAWNYATKFISVDSVTGASEWCTDSCVDVLLGEKCVEGVSAKGSACVAVPFGVSAWNYATKFVSDVFARRRMCRSACVTDPFGRGMFTGPGIGRFQHPNIPLV